MFSLATMFVWVFFVCVSVFLNIDSLIQISSKNNFKILLIFHKIVAEFRSCGFFLRIIFLV